MPRRSSPLPLAMAERRRAFQNNSNYFAVLDLCPMKYVYVLQSVQFPERFYVGLTTDIKKRLVEHNQGKSIHSNKFAPWKLKTYIAFEDGQKTFEFERYLKTSSGRAFTIKRL